MHKAKYHLLSLVQDPFPGINHSELFLTVISDNVIDKNYDETKVMHIKDGSTHLDDIFAELDLVFPTLTIKPSPSQQIGTQGHQSVVTNEDDCKERSYFDALKGNNTRPRNKRIQKKARMSIQEPQSKSDLSSSSDDSLSTRKSRLRTNKKKVVTLVATQENNTALTIPNSWAVLKQSNSAWRLMDDVSEITQSDTTLVIRSELHSKMSSMRTELLQMQAKIQEYHTTQTNLVDTVQTMQDDTKESRGKLCMIMDIETSCWKNSKIKIVTLQVLTLSMLV